ncbi:hypothetical protein OG900_27325 [Streptomyces sp. NBC_00433]
MDFETADFSGATEYFAGPGSAYWSDLAYVIGHLRLQPSGEDGMTGNPNFGPKATNRILTEQAALLGWEKIPVPDSPKAAFGLDWDAGRGAVLVEWQFSNYPFLWNNIIRSQVAVHRSLLLQGMDSVPQALVVVTKSGCPPASRSTLYFEQAKAQLGMAAEALDLDIAVRLVGLTIPAGCATVDADWNTYPGRTARKVPTSTPRDLDVTWSHRSRSGQPVAKIHVATADALPGL